VIGVLHIALLYPKIYFQNLLQAELSELSTQNLY
jgi:hypothetical protein